MADWDFPKTSSTYVEVLSELQDKANDQAKLFDGTGTTGSLPIGTKRWNVSKFETRTALGWDDITSEYEINVQKLDNKTGAKYVNTDGAQDILGAKTFKTGAFTVESSANFKNDITLGNAASNTITVNGKIGASTFNGDITLESTASISVGENASITGTLTVGSSSSLSSLAVSGTASLNGAVNLGNAAADLITINGTVHGPSNLITFADDLKLNEDLTVDKTITVTGAATFNGAVTLGNAAADIITITGAPTFSTNIIAPSINLAGTSGDSVIKLQPAASGATCGIRFDSKVNAGSDYGYIVWHDDNDTYNLWGNSTENGALVIGVQNDGQNVSSDVVVLTAPAAVITDAEHRFLGNVKATDTSSGVYFSGILEIGGGTTGAYFYNDGRLKLRNTSEATSVSDSSVSLDVEGGATIAKNLYVGGTIYESSAKELKRNIKPIVGALGKVLKLEGVSYEKKDTGKQEIGLIADDVLGIIPEVVSSKDGKAEALHYTRLTAVLVEAVKELTHKVESLEEQLQRS
jgi:hypothetical protein